MAEALSTFVKTFDFIEDSRSAIDFIGNIRLDPTIGAGAVVLKSDSNGYFPTTGDNYIVGPLFKPKAVRQWKGLQVTIVHQYSSPGNPITGDGFRLHDGTDQWWWDGGAWAISTTDWNTEADIATNIASFPATARQIRLVIRLTTTDKKVTPILLTAKLGWSGRVFALEDIVYRSLVPLLKTARVPIDAAVKVPFPGGTTMDIGSLIAQMDVPFNVVDIESIFNNTDDPGSYDDKLASYNTTTKKATLTVAIPVGNVARIRMLVQPDVAVEQSSQDFDEIEKVPAILISDFEEINAAELTAGEDGFANKATGDAMRIPAPYRFDMQFTMILLASKGVDLMRMVDSIVGLMEESPFVTSAAMDEKYRLWLVDEFATRTAPNLADLASTAGKFQLLDVLSFKRPAVQEKAVGTVQVGGDFNFDV